MAISVKWLVPDYVLYSSLEGDITADLVEFDDTMQAFMNSSSQPIVHGITDISRVTKLAPIRHTINMKCIRHPKTGWMISVGAIKNPVVRMLATMTMSVVRARYCEAQTMENALIILQEKVHTLPDLKQAFSLIQE